MNGPPPKPIRGFQPGMNSLGPGGSSGPNLMPPEAPQRSGAVTMAGPLSPRHDGGPPYHPNRPLPERPYSVAGQYPSPERRSYQDFSGYLSSPERRMPQNAVGMRSSFSGFSGFEDPYGTHGPRSGSVTPVVDEEARARMEMMERQLASLTGIVQKVLTPGPKVGGKCVEMMEIREMLLIFASRSRSLVTSVVCHT